MWRPHAVLKREGTELYLESEISIAQAALGTTITIPTVDGDETLEIKPGVQPGAEIRLRGKGVPHLRRGGQRGDLHVFVKVAVPTKLSKKQREHLAAYAAEAGEPVGDGDGGILGSGQGRPVVTDPAGGGAPGGERVPGASGEVGLPASGEGLSASGAWLELSVTADPEAVEAVSEILSRWAPGGTTVEPAFELVDEGLGARLDPSRPAIVRAYMPSRDTGAARRAVEDIRIALGHLQAFGLRPIGELETRVVHEEDWAHAWKTHFPVLRVGRRLVIRPTWRRHRRAPDDVVLALDPGMAFGTGLHPTTRLCLAGIERWADEGRLGPGRGPVATVGSGSSTSAAARVSWPSPPVSSVRPSSSGSTPIPSRPRPRSRMPTGTGSGRG